MAKGNLFQGMGRGKVGDVVFSRLNGEQLSRVRNRNPKNPNTNKQLYQRAIMATVMQAYSAGIVIFDHAFQGREIGAANQRRFISLNAKLLRSQVAADIKGAVALEDQQGRVVAPGVSSPVAAALQVSEGTLRNVLFGSTVPEPLTDETVGAYCARIGLVAGDLFTFVAFKNDSTSEILFSVNGVDSNLAKQYKTQFLFARYAVKESAISDTTTAFANLGQILELTDSNYTPLVDFSTFDGGDEAPAMQTMCGQDAYGTYGWIRSRKNSDLRSKCVLSFDGRNTGIASQYALQAWSQGTANLGDSDLILEGGGGVEPVIPSSNYIKPSDMIQITNTESEYYGAKIGTYMKNGERMWPCSILNDGMYNLNFIIQRSGAPQVEQVQLNTMEEVQNYVEQFGMPADMLYNGEDTNAANSVIWPLINDIAQGWVYKVYTNAKYYLVLMDQGIFKLITWSDGKIISKVDNKWTGNIDAPTNLPVITAPLQITDTLNFVVNTAHPVTVTAGTASPEPDYGAIYTL